MFLFTSVVPLLCLYLLSDDEYDLLLPECGDMGRVVSQFISIASALYVYWITLMHFFLISLIKYILIKCNKHCKTC